MLACSRVGENYYMCDYYVLWNPQIYSTGSVESSSSEETLLSVMSVESSRGATATTTTTDHQSSLKKEKSLRPPPWPHDGDKKPLSRPFNSSAKSLLLHYYYHPFSKLFLHMGKSRGKLLSYTKPLKSQSLQGLITYRIPHMHHILELPNGKA